MEPLHVVHLVIVGLWGGLVLGESVLELGARDEATLRNAARVHYWMDVLVELPLLLALLASGAWLTLRAWPPTTLHLVKIGAALVPVGLNLYCAGVVVLRYRQRADPTALAHHSRRVRLSGVGIPFALVAAYLGLVYFRR